MDSLRLSNFLQVDPEAWVVRQFLGGFFRRQETNTVCSTQADGMARIVRHIGDRLSGKAHACCRFSHFDEVAIQPNRVLTHCLNQDQCSEVRGADIKSVRLALR